MKKDFSNIVNQLAQYFTDGQKENSDHKNLGVEIEHFVLDKNNKSVIIQRYCKQYYSANVPMDVYDTYDSCSENGMNLVQDWTDMTGLFMYEGKFADVYLRLGIGNINNIKYGNIEGNVFYEEYRS